MILKGSISASGAIMVFVYDMFMNKMSLRHLKNCGEYWQNVY